MTSPSVPGDRTSGPPIGRAIVVMGVSGSGKTTLASAVAGALGYTFVEGDDLHPAANVAKMSAAVALTDDDRWPWLGRVAAQIRDLNEIGCVISCSALKRSYRDYIRNQAGGGVTFVYQEVDDMTLANRLKSRPGHYMHPSLLDSQLATLERPDADEAALHLSGRLSPEILSRQVLEYFMGSEGTP